MVSIKAETALASAAQEIAEYASYAEIVGGITTNRAQIRKRCDEVFAALRDIRAQEDQAIDQPQMTASVPALAADLVEHAEQQLRTLLEGPVDKQCRPLLSAVLLMLKQALRAPATERGA